MKILRYNKFKFINENVGEAKSLLNKMNISQDNPDFKQLQKWLINNSGYLGWFTKLRFENQVPMSDLEKVWTAIKDNKVIVSRFEKPVVSLGTLAEFWSSFNEAKEVLLAKSMQNKLLPNQKSMLDIENEKERKLLVDLYNDKDKKIFLENLKRYSKKISLIDALSTHLYKKTSNDFDELLTELKSKKVKVWHADKSEDLILCTVNYEQLVEFAGDTGWCTLDPFQFESYNGEYLGKQWIIFLLDQSGNYSKIGTSPYLGMDSKIRFYDCRLKGDISIQVSELFEILEARGCSKDIFYKSMKDHFEKQDTNIDFVPVKTLLTIGLDKKEILSRKKRFKEEDLEFLNDAERKLAEESISSQDNDNYLVMEILSKLDDEQKKSFNLDLEKDFNLLLKVGKDKDKQKFLENLKFLKTREILRSSFEKFAYKKDKYSFEEIKSSLRKKAINILFEDADKGLLLVPFEFEMLGKVAEEFDFDLPEKQRKFFAPEKTSNKIQLELFLFKVGIGDIFSRMQIEVTIFTNRAVSNTATEFQYNCNISDNDGRTIYVSWTKNLLFSVLTHLGFRVELLDELMKKHLLTLDDWNALSLELLLNLGYNLKTIKEKKELYISDDMKILNDKQANILEIDKKVNNTNSLFVKKIMSELPSSMRKEYEDLITDHKKYVDNLFIELNLLDNQSIKSFLYTIENVDNLQDLCYNLNRLISMKNWQKKAKS